MRKGFNVLALLILVALFTAGCSILPPKIPTGLLATGSLGHIVLRWNASKDGGLTEYRIYRGTNPAQLVKVASVPAANHTYDDSGVRDGVLYYYAISAVADRESIKSNMVFAMHGTRLQDQTGDFMTVQSESPYVIEGRVNLGGSLFVPAGTSLYALAGSAVTFTRADQVSTLLIAGGLIDMRGTRFSPVSIASSGAGYELRLDHAAAGSRLEHAQLRDLTGDLVATAITVFACSPTISHCRFESKNNDALFEIYRSGAYIDHCLFDGLSLSFRSEQESALYIGSSIWMNGRPAIMFGDTSTWLPLTGQLSNNAFQCSGTASSPLSAADLGLSIDTPGTVQLAGNCFFRGSSGDTVLTDAAGFFVDDASGTADFDFLGLLTALPTGIGPDWGINPF